jgi:glyoxylase-like metal-dependent hydrolase (beta-lactamase superfamily II)
MEILDVPGRMGRCQLILAAEGITLVDAGADPRARAILEAFNARGLSLDDLRRIVLTHGDGDHIAGARLLQDQSRAEVIAHELEVSYIAGRVPAGFPLAKRALALVGRRLPRPRVTRIVSGAALAIRTGNVFREVPAAMTVDRDQARETIRALAERNILTAYSGHGPVATDASRRLRALAASLRSPGP